jgi:regulator of sigma E protease
MYLPLLAIDWKEVGIIVAQFFLSLTILITLHEFGHYITARWFKTRVEKFYLFFDFLFPFSNLLPFSLIKKKIGETTWGLGWFPLGGYVKIAGMVDESADSEALKQPPQPWEFRSKKAYQRLIIMLGGIIVNVLVAFLIFYFLLLRYGLNRVETTSLKNGVHVTDSAFYKFGMRNGDKIVAVDGVAIKYFDNLTANIIYSKGNITVNRNNANIELKAPVDIIKQLNGNKLPINLRMPFKIVIGEIRTVEGVNNSKTLMANDSLLKINGSGFRYYDEYIDTISKYKNQEITVTVNRKGSPLDIKATVNKEGNLGVLNKAEGFDEEDLEKLGELKQVKQSYNGFSAVGASFSMMFEKTKFYLQGLKKLVSPESKAYQKISGFKGMAKAFPPYWDWHAFWRITGILSLILAIMNLLPIPGLDGGYVLFTLIEMIIGRKINEKFMGIITTVGLVFLLCLMLFANLNDWIKFF